tara:strand:- start:6 stop:698 length:693 start_codon:yes stop_codon:yes gene_type:complete
MSKVSFSPIQPGDAASIAAPNATMSATAASTAAVNAENVRVEGLDERSLAFPLISTLSYDSGDWSRILKTPLDAWYAVPHGGTWNGGTGSLPTFAPGVLMMVNLSSNFNHAVIRYSFTVSIEGRVAGSNEEVGFAILANGVHIWESVRYIQNSISHGAAATLSGVCRSEQSVTLLHYTTITSPVIFHLEYFIGTNGQGALAADKTNISWVNNVDDVVTISRLTASVIKYK